MTKLSEIYLTHYYDDIDLRISIKLHLDKNNQYILSNAEVDVYRGDLNQHTYIFKTMDSSIKVIKNIISFYLETVYYHHDFYCIQDVFSVEKMGLNQNMEDDIGWESSCNVYTEITDPILEKQINAIWKEEIMRLFETTNNNAKLV